MEKKQCTLLLTLAAAAACGAAVPVEWDVEVARVQSALFSAYRGETLELAARMLRGGRPFEAAPDGAALYWQTNGMGTAYWTAPASCASNVLSAVWSPTNDVGAAMYNCFIGAPRGNYRAAFRLRLLDSPGASPNTLPLPVRTLDFATVEIANAPYYLKAETDAAIAENATAAAEAKAAAQEAQQSANNALYGMTQVNQKITAIGNGAATKTALAAAALAATNYTDTAVANIDIPDTADYSTGNTQLVATIKATAPAPDLSGYATTNDVGRLAEDNAATRAIVTTWEGFLDGSNVVFSITNYIGGSYNLDAAKLRILELKNGEYREVYNSRDEILLHIDAFKTNDFRVATNQVIGAVNEAIENKADKDWGKYTSAGGEAPENTVYMTAPNTVFAGGLEYERVAVGEGAICVLTTRGAPVWTQGDEGTFKFQDGGGTNYFGFAKTDSYTIGANTDGIVVQGGMVTLTYNITMSGRPCVWYAPELSANMEWEQLNLPDGSPVSGASHVVSWDADPPADTQMCYINVGTSPQGFFRTTIEVAGEAKFMTNMPADLAGGIICTNTARGVSGIIKPTFDGSAVNWTWSAQ